MHAGTLLWTRLKAWCAHAFAVGGDADALSLEECEMVERLADFVVRRRMSGPALMVLEGGRPLNFVGSQALVFLAPFAKLVFSPLEYDRFVSLLEKRRSIDILIEAIGKREDRENE